MFSILENLASADNGLNDKVQQDYTLFSLVTPRDHESCHTATHISLQTSIPVTIDM